MGVVSRGPRPDATDGVTQVPASPVPSRPPTEVGVLGMGYVGLTLAVSLAQAGVRVLGIESDPKRLTELRLGRVPFYESGLSEAMAAVTERLSVSGALPDPIPAALVVCVGTPLDAATREPRLDLLRDAIDNVAKRIDDETLVIIRSTVPVGTTRTMVLPRLKERVAQPLVAFCPERTIQGRALEELARLPQVIGGPPQARRRAAKLFGRLTPHIVEVESTDAAELVKLVNNAHTDLIYGFGNEVALIANAVGVDADEVIAAANADYPRPDLAQPGYVGGSCLVKDPYMLLESARRHGYDPSLVAAARRLNEHVPVHVAERVIHELERRGVRARDASVLLCGVAYKGRPETDDVRGSAAEIVGRLLRARVKRLLGHDFVVSDRVVADLGLEPCELLEGCSQANALILLNDHPGYAAYTWDDVSSRLGEPGLIYDLWGVYKSAAGEAAATGLYLRLAKETLS
jgi:UDP-N-acetyl-D-mannosaminuronic acid dehydrogenase